MTTGFALLCRACGLSHREAAGYLHVRLDTVKSWASGRNQAPPRVLEDLAGLLAKIETAAREGLAGILARIDERGEPPDVIGLGLSCDDAEAQSIGWPCVGAQQAALGQLIAHGIAHGLRFSVVPLGTTVETAGAADAHGR